MYAPRRLKKRRHMIYRAASTKLLLPIGAILLLILFLALRVDGAEEAAAVVDGYVSTTSTYQSDAYITYLTYEERTAVDDSDYLNTKRDEGDWEVSGTGNEKLDRALSAYSYIAYNLDAALDYVYSNEKGSTQVDRDGADFSTVDRRVLAAGFVACFKSEIGGCDNGVDVVENWQSFSALREKWKGMDYKDKLSALEDDDWLKDNGFALTAIQEKGYWGYGIIQFTAGRRKNLASFGQREGVDITSLAWQMQYSLMEWYCKLSHTPVPYFHEQLLDKDFTAESCAYACDLIYTYTVRTGSGYVASLTLNTDRHENINTQNWYGTGMTMFEALKKFDSAGVAAFRRDN